ncbi:MAG: hypothetical protein ACOC2L_05310 [Candidatus Sumerlaeota bacterium]
MGRKEPRENPWDDFQAVRRSENSGKERFGYFLVYLFSGGFGFVLGGLIGVFWKYRRSGYRRTVDFEAMAADTEDAARMRFLIAGFIGLALALAGVWKMMRSR